MRSRLWACRLLCRNAAFDPESQPGNCLLLTLALRFDTTRSVSAQARRRVLSLTRLLPPARPQ